MTNSAVSQSSGTKIDVLLKKKRKEEREEEEEEKKGRKPRGRARGKSVHFFCYNSVCKTKYVFFFFSLRFTGMFYTVNKELR